MRHCWTGRQEYYEELYGWGSNEWAEVYVQPGATCMLEADHEGMHEWTPDADIGISLVAEPSES